MLEVVVEGLTKTFGSQRALDDVSFTVQEGEFFTLLGPSGCGKSTTLMSIAGFQSPETGRIRVGSQIFFDHREKVGVRPEKRNLGIVFQSYAVWPHMTVFENVAFPLRARRTTGSELKRRVLQSLELVEMDTYAGRYPHQLSGGQQQRIALARALVYSPAVLLLDEPFSNLDAKLRERARSWLKDLQRELAITTVFVTHDQDEALSMSDRVLVMNEGRVLQIDTPEIVYRAPADRFVASFVGQCNFVSATVMERRNNQTVVDTALGFLTIPGSVGADGDEVTLAIRPESILIEPEQSDGVNVLSMRITSRSFLGDHYEYGLFAGGVTLIASSSALLNSDTVDVVIPVDALAPLSSPTTNPTHEVLML